MPCSPSTQASCAPTSTGDTALEGAISPPGMALSNQSGTSSEVPQQQKNASEQAGGDSEEERPCPFLSIPAELRNRIYREALVPLPDKDGDTITFASVPDSDDMKYPPLLCTCKQIREEATSIYEQENVFYIIVNNFDICWLQEWWDNLISPSKVSLTIWSDGEFDGDNLVHWLEASCDEGFPLLGGSSRCTGHCYTRANLAAEPFFDTMQHLRARGLSWNNIEVVLENMRETLRAVLPDFVNL